MPLGPTHQTPEEFEREIVTAPPEDVAEVCDSAILACRDDDRRDARLIAGLAKRLKQEVSKCTN
jgi:hypothetical protein